ncbi:hypothetical protein M9Y10_036179 [Tritrichomonas musculus]|uniref:Uncharacterized protein n=1 Tax=Tritrichomonas musculus TaxID=1915356 RepID=A0ABR2GW87_9EUKA
MSKIPILNRGNNNRRDSLARPDAFKHNEPRRPLSRISNNQISSQNTPKVKSKRSNIFLHQPTMSGLNGRKLPDDILGKQKTVGNGNSLDLLFRYINKIGKPFFVPEFSNLVFPKALSTLHQITVSKYESKKNLKKNPRSSIAVASEITDTDNKPKDLGLTPVFDQFNLMIRNNKNQLMCMTDFLLLYCAYLIIVCEGNSDNMNLPLYFLKIFIQLPDLPKRPQEAEVLASALMKKAGSEPAVRGHSTEAMNFLVHYENSILNRVRSGCECHDTALSEFCRKVMALFNGGLPTNQAPPPPTFATISEIATESVSNDMMTSFLSAFEAGEKPRDLISFISNIVQTMNRFARSAPILEKGSNLIKFSLNLLQPSPPIETVSQVINLCYSILSGELFLSGNDSFDALEAIQSLSNIIFEIIPSDVLLAAIAATIANSADSLLCLLMKKLSEYYQEHRNEINKRQLAEIASTLDAFHPDFKERPPFLNINFGLDEKLASMTESIEKLMNPDTLFEEMENVIKQDPAILNDYPLYLRGFLQRAYYLYHNEEPAGMSEDQRQLAESMTQEINSISNEDLVNGGKYSVEVLSAQLEEMKSYNNSSW